MTADEMPASAVSESGDGRADQGGIANTGVIHGDVRAEFHVHHHHPRELHDVRPEGHGEGRRPWSHRRLTRRLLIGTVAAAGLGVSGAATAWRYGTESARRSSPTPSGTVTFGPDARYDPAGRKVRPAGRTIWSIAAGTLRGEPLVVAGRGDGRIQLWNPVTGRARSDLLPAHHGKVFGLALHGTMAASTSVDGTMRVWDLTSDPPRATAPTTGIAGGVNGVAFATVGGRTVAVTACGDRTVRIWDPAHPQRGGRALGSALGAPVNSIAVGTIDGRAIAVTGSADGAITLWDVTGERMLRELGSHTGEVWGLAVGIVNGKPTAVSGGEDGVLRRWDLGAAQPSGEQLLKLTKAFKTVAIGEVAGRTVAVSGCDDSGIRIWDLGAGQPYGRALTGPEKTAEAIAISDFSGRPTVVSGHYDGTIWAWTL
ncbi:WD40 repeat domain-containing protein [Actinoplanes subglobosus]|uniref:WD40 repeat domain-containing protein n=1 Tax=Actinoplanes subglobosus TaxID=1547892 RepID=A0ABV8J0I5_9ACTN